jgi:glycosyltransferase involved in cell wall biosynthesis
MTRFALTSQCLSEADAVSHDVLGMYRALVARGHQVRIFADEWHGEVPAVRRFSRLGAWLDGPDTVLIYHHSVGWDGGVEAVQRARARRVVRYHNVTPPEFFEAIHHDYAFLCRLGRAQLPALARAGCTRYLCDSTYNLGELLDAGVRPDAAVVVPPFHTIARLQTLDADLAVLDQYRDGRTNLLMVGRVAPNKGHRALLDAFAVYHGDYNRHSRLLIVGKEDERLSIYTRALRLRVRELGLDGAVVFTGALSDRALKACYLAADVFVITSEHEGFCVPLVEAMALKVPIVALARAAVPATVGGAGLVWDEADPVLFAESVHQIIRDEEARLALAELGARRYREHLTVERIRDRFLAALEGVL